MSAVSAEVRWAAITHGRPKHRTIDDVRAIACTPDRVAIGEARRQASIKTHRNGVLLPDRVGFVGVWRCPIRCSNEPALWAGMLVPRPWGREGCFGTNAGPLCAAWCWTSRPVNVLQTQQAGDARDDGEGRAQP
ncbi:Uncharacterised protein [Bordetella pertussis]|nr:Uncharacterised protein [Bordetella pertussis]